MPRSKSSSSAPKTRKRRGEDQLIADLQAKIEHLKARAATKAAKKDPTFRHVNKAIKAIDAAMDATGDAALRRALQEARVTLAACLQLQGVAVPRNGRASSTVDPGTLYAFVQKNPGQRGEHIAAALQVDSKTLRGPMKRLIEEGKVRTKGERRGMQYFTA
jgi:predicted ArsR family transcriptional regulator